MFTKRTYKFSLIAVLIALSATEMIEEAVWQDSEWLKSNLEELDNYLIRDIPSQVGKQSKEQLGFFVSNGYNRPNIISLLIMQDCLYNNLLFSRAGNVH